LLECKIFGRFFFSSENDPPSSVKGDKLSRLRIKIKKKSEEILGILASPRRKPIFPDN
jgi:hypothetical protein